MLKKTFLNAEHNALGARMVDFGGWEMPVNYGSQVDEHHAVRHDAGMFDVSHMVVFDVRGKDARTFLRYALANNIDKLQDVGRAFYTCFLNERGGVIDDMIVYFLDDFLFRIVLNAGTADKDIALLEALRTRQESKVTFERRDDLGILAVQGPNAATLLWKVLPKVKENAGALAPFHAIIDGDYFIARTGYTGEDGFEIIAPHETIKTLWQDLLEARVKPCGLGARDTLRLEAGMALYGQEMDEAVTPLEAGLGWTVDLKSKRDFIGKEALLAQKPIRRFVGLLLLEAGGVLRAHQIVHTKYGDGEITSGTFSPTLNQSIALARVPPAVEDGATVEVSVRNKRLAARVVKPPFARHGKILVEPVKS